MKNNGVGILSVFIIISVIVHSLLLFVSQPTSDNYTQLITDSIPVALIHKAPPSKPPPLPVTETKVLPESISESVAVKKVEEVEAEVQPEVVPAVAQEAVQAVNNLEPAVSMVENVEQVETVEVNPFAALMQRMNDMKSTVYPLRAKKKGYQGTVLVELRLDSEGRLIDAVIVQKSRYSILDRAALELVELVLEDPYHHNLGKNVTLKMPITFKLL